MHITCGLTTKLFVNYLTKMSSKSVEQWWTLIDWLSWQFEVGNDVFPTRTIRRPRKFMCLPPAAFSQCTSLTDGGNTVNQGTWSKCWWHFRCESGSMVCPRAKFHDSLQLLLLWRNARFYRRTDVLIAIGETPPCVSSKKNSWAKTLR